MSHRILLAALLLPALSGVSFAQSAPGACEDCYAPVPPPAAVYAPELARRIGVGVHVSSLAIKNEATPDQPTELGGGGLQIRYRLNPRWSLQVAVDALTRHDEEGMPQGPEYHSATAGALFHLTPLRRWDWYLLAAVGGFHEGNRDTRGSMDQRGRGQVHLGVGLERRWHRLGVGVELRAVGIAPEETPEAPATTGTTPMRRVTTPPPGTEADRRGDQGAQMSIAATYYF